MRLSLLGQDERLAGEWGAFGHSRNSFPTPRKSEHPRSRTAGTCFRTVTSLARGGGGAGFGGSFAWRTRGSGSCPWGGAGVPGGCVVRGRPRKVASWGKGRVPDASAVRSACQAVFASAGSPLRARVVRSRGPKGRAFGPGWVGSGARLAWRGDGRRPSGVAWGRMSAGCSRGVGSDVGGLLRWREVVGCQPAARAARARMSRVRGVSQRPGGQLRVQGRGREGRVRGGGGSGSGCVCGGGPASGWP
ncbi:hypothetical protein QF027_003997 [Streptomyces canus]|nr:hypothetical protein [Streptomyces canus]